MQEYLDRFAIVKYDAAQYDEFRAGRVRAEKAVKNSLAGGVTASSAANIAAQACAREGAVQALTGAQQYLAVAKELRIQEITVQDPGWFWRLLGASKKEVTRYVP